MANQKQKQIILNLLKWMKKTDMEITLHGAIDKPEILQHGMDDDICDADVSFVFYVNDPRKTLKFLDDDMKLDGIVDYLKSHKQSIIDTNRNQAKFAKQMHESYDWKWPQPCDQMTFDISTQLENALEDDETSLEDMGLAFDSAYVDDTQI